jgi:hypothetical protein
MYLGEMISKGDATVDHDTQIQNQYIELLCIHEKHKVYPYLRDRDSSISYDLQQALDAVTRHHIVEATIFLLEKTVMIDQAMDILMQDITTKLNKLRAAVIETVSKEPIRNSTPMPNMSMFGAMSVTEDYSKFSFSAAFRTVVDPDKAMTIDELFPTPKEENEAVLRMVDVGIDLCTRYHSRSSAASKNWFRLLDRFTKPKRLLFDRQVILRDVPGHGGSVDGFEDNEVLLSVVVDRASGSTVPLPLLVKPLTPRGIYFIEKMQSIYTEYTSHILSAMVKILDLAAVVGKIVDDNERESFGPYKKIIVDILESLSFELEVNQLCKLCTDADTMKLGRDYRALLNAGIMPKTEYCGACGRHLGEMNVEDEWLRFYACGHGFHESCCVGSTECPQCVADRAGVLLCRSTAPQGRTGPTSAAPATASSSKDIGTMLRRLRRARRTMDDTRNYNEILHSILSKQDSKALSEEASKRVGVRSLLLAPAPPQPFALGDPAGGTVAIPTEVRQALTDEEISELFGEWALENLKTSIKTEEEAKRSQSRPLSEDHALGDDEEDFDLDAALNQQEDDEDDD